MDIKIIPAYDHLQEVGVLFSEYTNMLIEGDSSFRNYLDMQHYDEKVKHPESKYGFPDGRLYIAYWKEEKEIGYSYMLLDTLPFLESAIRMYTNFGFYRIESYNDNPMNTAIYMKLDL